MTDHRIRSRGISYDGREVLECLDCPAIWLIAWEEGLEDEGCGADMLLNGDESVVHDLHPGGTLCREGDLDVYEAYLGGME